MTMIINLTPHEVAVFRQTGSSQAHQVIRRYPSSGAVVRFSQARTTIGVLDGVPVSTVVFGDLYGLPPEQPDVDVWYIVPGVVLAALPARPDLLAPAIAVRDADGRIIGCRGFDITPAGKARLQRDALLHIHANSRDGDTGER